MSTVIVGSSILRADVETPLATAAQRLTSDESRKADIEQLWEEHKRSQAERRLDEWKKAEKNSPLPWILEARFEHDLGHYKKAISLCDKALEKSSLSAEAFYWKGKSLESLNKFLEAANEYRAALLARAEYAEAQAGLDRVSAKMVVISR